MHYVGSNDSRHEDYQIVFKKVKIEQAKYACRCCNKIVVAKGSKLPIDKGLPLSGLLAQTILDKFSSAIPQCTDKRKIMVTWGLIILGSK